MSGPGPMRLDLNATDLEAGAQLHDVVLEGAGLRLRPRLLVEDDATAIGRPQGAADRSWFEGLVPGVVIRKDLVLDDGRARAVWLTWCGTEADDNEVALHLRVNGVEIVRPASKSTCPQCRHYYTADWGGSHFDNWFVVAVPVGALRAGVNRVEMWCPAGGTPPAWEVMIAADSERPRGSEPPRPPVGRSARSRDRGATWEGRLGGGAGMAGEYCVRLSLERHPRHGVLCTAPIDVTGAGEGPVMGQGPVGRAVESPTVRAAERPPAQAVERAPVWAVERRVVRETHRPRGAPAVPGVLFRHVRPARCRVTCQVDRPAGTAARARVRWADTPRPDAAQWSEWQDLVDLSGHHHAPPGRWLQVEVELTTVDPLVSPVLRGVRLETSVEAGPWTGSGGRAEPAGLGQAVARGDDPVAQAAPGRPDSDPATRPRSRPRLLMVRNGRVTRSSFPYVWEDPEALADLRQRFELDAVVAPAATEFEAQLRLMHWAWRVPLGQLEPYAWRYHDLPRLERDETDAIRLLGPYDGSRREGHCLYCNLTLVAALLAFGYPARWVNISTKHTYGHEVAEVWSNDFDKWVHLDATRDFHIYDLDTGIPMSLTEIADRVGRAVPEPVTWDRPIQAQVDHYDPHQLGIACRTANRGIDLLVEGGTDLLQMIGHLQMPLRNDFASRPQPVPWRLSSNWGSSEFLTWHSERFPPKLEYDRTTCRLQDWEPRLNQAQVYLFETGVPGRLRVEVDTVTPWLEAFEARLDGGDWEECVSPVWTWALHEGLNRLRVRVRNRLDVRGPESQVRLVLPG